jgi:hypothetical protein
MIGQTTTVNVATTDTTLGGSSPTRVFNLTVLSDGTAGVCTLKNGTTVWVNPTFTINKSVTIDFGEEGLLFPAGCSVDVDAHCIATLVTYRVEEV